MFDKVPASSRFPAKPSYCSCWLGTAMHHLLSHHLDSRSHLEMASGCKGIKHLQFSSLIPDLDITSEYINSEALAGKLSPHVPREENNLNFLLQKNAHPNLSKLDLNLPHPGNKILNPPAYLSDERHTQDQEMRKLFPGKCLFP